MKRLPATAAPLARRPPRGFGLVELMVALTLGMVMIAAMGQLYSGSRQAYVTGNTMARLSENGRFAEDFLANDLRMAGYFSCGGQSARIGNSVDGVGSWIYRTGGIEGYEGGVDTLPSELMGQVRPGTDVLIVRRAAIDLERTLIQRSASGMMRLGLDHGFKIGEILVISDPSCTQTSIFQVTDLVNQANPSVTDVFDSVVHDASVDVGPGNCTDSLIGSFDCSTPGMAENGEFRQGSVVSRFGVSAYYVTASDPPTLVRKRLSQSEGHATLVTDELIRDVENLQVLYGRDTLPDSSHSVDDYVTADQIADWDKVVSVHFGLLMRSREAQVRTAPALLYYDLPGSTVLATADHRLRRVFGGVVALRNHLP